MTTHVAEDRFEVRDGAIALQTVAPIAEDSNVRDRVPLRILKPIEGRRSARVESVVSRVVQGHPTACAQTRRIRSQVRAQRRLEWQPAFLSALLCVSDHRAQPIRRDGEPPAHVSGRVARCSIGGGMLPPVCAGVLRILGAIQASPLSDLFAMHGSIFRFGGARLPRIFGAPAPCCCIPLLGMASLVCAFSPAKLLVVLLPAPPHCGQAFFAMFPVGVTVCFALLFDAHRRILTRLSLESQTCTA